MTKISWGTLVAGGLALTLAACNSSPQATATAPTSARSAPSVADLVDARGSSGEMALQNRGYAPARTAGLTTYWRHPAGACVRVVTSQGRYKVVEPVSPAQCGNSASAAPVPAASARTSTSTISRAMPTKDEQACLLAAMNKTQNGDVVLFTGTETSEANNAVYVGVGPQRAKWRCLVKNGRVADVMSMTDEGRL